MATYFTDWESELVHHGIPHMKWGERRFQNEDGSLTPEGAKRYGQKSLKKASLIQTISDSGTGANYTSKSSQKQSNKEMSVKTEQSEKHTTATDDYVQRKIAEAKAADEKRKEQMANAKAASDKKKKKGKKKSSSGSKSSAKSAVSTNKQKHSRQGPKANLSKYDVSSSVMNKVHALLTKGRS